MSKHREVRLPLVTSMCSDPRTVYRVTACFAI